MQDDRREAAMTAGLSNDPITTRLSRGDKVFGERLLPIAEGPVPIRGAARGTLALRESGSAVLIVSLPTMTSRAVGDAADHMDRLAELGEQGLAELAGREIAEIRREHDGFFERTSPPASLNRDQALIVVVEREPSTDAWDTVMTEVGDRLQGIYRASGGEVEPVRDPRMSSMGRIVRMPLLVWLGIIGFFVGGALAFYGLTRGGNDVPTSAPLSRVSASVGTVATGSPIGATLSRWIGQQRFVRLSTGHLLFVYPDPAGLMIVRDQKDLGRAWRSPQSIDGIQTESISVAVDDRDRLHVAYADANGTHYLMLVQRESRWAVDAEIELDPQAVGQVIDLAWDPSNEAVHLVWTTEADDGEQPMWGVVDVGGDPLLETSEPLSDPGDATALGNIAAGSNGRVVATYRKQTSPEGWFSRDIEAGDAGFTLGAEASLPNVGAVVGAASLEIDADDTAHLVLRNDAEFDLMYYRGREGAGWTTGTLVLDGATTDQVEHPSLSIDQDSGLMYIYVQTNAFIEENSEIRLIVRDPATGWSGPFPITDPSQIPQGAIYPTSMGVIRGQPLVAWTTVGGGPAINLARVVAP